MVDAFCTKVVVGAVAIAGVLAYFLFYILLEAKLSGRILVWQEETAALRAAHYDPLQDVEVVRRRRPSDRPELCVAALSCRRYDLLDRTLSSAVGHLERFEPDVDYELVVFDNGQRNGTNHYFRYQVVEKYQVDNWGVSEKNRGVGYGLNLLFHGLCRAPFVLSLEDDWEFQPHDKPILRAAMNALKHDQGLIGVYIKVPPLEAWLLATDNGTTPDGTGYRKVVTPPGASRYHFANGGTLLNRQLLQKVGLQKEGFFKKNENDGEFDYKKRCMQHNLTMGILKGGPDGQGWVAMSHIGDSRHVDRNSTRKR